jgi:hypothetical protein
MATKAMELQRLEVLSVGDFAEAGAFVSSIGE